MMLTKKLLIGFMAVAICGLFITYAVNAADNADRKQVPSLTKAQCQGQEESVSYPDHPKSEKLYRSIFLEEDFEETTFPPSGWDTTNYNPGFGWFRNIAALGGTYCALVTWDNVSPITLQDEWLFTPGMDVSEATDLLRLDFWFFKDNFEYQHELKIYISTVGGTNHADYTEIWDSYDIQHPNMNWWETSVDLSNYAGSADDIYLAFQYLGTDANLCGIDDIVVTDDPPPPGRCCSGDPFDPVCEDGVTAVYCNGIGGYWAEGLNCVDNPCPPAGRYIEPSDDMYTDPNTGAGHIQPHPIAELWTADYATCQDHHERIMMKFDLVDFMDMAIDSAFLNIYRWFRCPNYYYTTCNFYNITQDWNEETWNEDVHISHGASAWANYTFGPANDWYRIDIKSAVEDWLDGTVTNYGFIIQAVYNQKFSKFYSKEGPAGLHPYLEMYLHQECVEAEGLRLVLDGDTIVAVDDVTVTGKVALEESTTGGNIEVFFLDETGDLFQPDPASFSLVAGIDNTDVAVTTITGNWQFTVTGNEQGQTDLTIDIWHGDHSDYTSPLIGVDIYKCGDINDDTTVDILDILFLIKYKYKEGPAPDPMSSGNVNSDANVDILDILYLIQYKYKEGPEPDCP